MILYILFCIAVIFIFCDQWNKAERKLDAEITDLRIRREQMIYCKAARELQKTGEEIWQTELDEAANKIRSGMEAEELLIKAVRS